jgi:hypothetical protein
MMMTRRRRRMIMLFICLLGAKKVWFELFIAGVMID